MVIDGVRMIYGDAEWTRTLTAHQTDEQIGRQSFHFGFIRTMLRPTHPGRTVA